MPIHHTPPPSALKTQLPATPTSALNMSQTLLHATSFSSSEPSLSSNIKLFTDNSSPIIPHKNIQRNRYEDEQANRLSNFMSDMKAMFSEFKQQQQENYEKIYSTVDKMRATVEFMSGQLEHMTSRVEVLESERKDHMSYIHKLENKLEHYEETARSTCLEIRNIPSSKSENKNTLLKTVIDTGKLINLDIKPDDVNDVFRIKSKDPANKTIIVNFNTVLRKIDFLAKYRSHNNNRYNITTEHLKINGPVKPIFISENLTARKKRLFFLARDAAKSNDYRFCWVKHGKIYVREKTGEKHFEVKCEADICNIKKSQ